MGNTLTCYPLIVSDSNPLTVPYSLPDQAENGYAAAPANGDTAIGNRGSDVFVAGAEVVPSQVGVRAVVKFARFVAS